jgi:hypothetical protein
MKKKQSLRAVARLAADWRTLEQHETWPKHWSKRKRTLAYMDKCKIADFDFTRYARRNLMAVLRALRKTVWLHSNPQPANVCVRNRDQMRKLISKLEKMA